MNAAALCTREVATCGPQMTVAEAAERMRGLHAGDLVVVRESDGVRVPVGVLTDRDIVLAVVSPDADADALFVGDVMSEPALVAHSGDDVWLLAKRMRRHGVRRLPEQQHAEQRQRDRACGRCRRAGGMGHGPPSVPGPSPRRDRAPEPSRHGICAVAGHRTRRGARVRVVPDIGGGRQVPPEVVP
ncbi:CBS domain-containing protein [Burkholderia ubonensis]|uniref:CBS domain-containing protein n=1 Tax=Burkholderia ubonensis TaxID=101571 RepID=UPI00288A3EA3|nr:CBS domain-containing protein [Burkholderia ubonensis]